eukprot:1801387-Prymnesium_polylepis.1
MLVGHCRIVGLSDCRIVGHCRIVGFMTDPIEGLTDRGSDSPIRDQFAQIRELFTSVRDGFARGSRRVRTHSRRVYA